MDSKKGSPHQSQRNLSGVVDNKSILLGASFLMTFATFRLFYPSNPMISSMLADGHLEEEPGVEERFQNGPGRRGPRAVVRHAEDAAGSFRDDLAKPQVELAIRGEALEHLDDSQRHVLESVDLEALGGRSGKSDPRSPNGSSSPPVWPRARRGTRGAAESAQVPSSARFA